MSTYHFPLKHFLPLLSGHKVPDRDVGLHGSLNSGCDFDKSCHLVVNWEVAGFGSGG